MITQHNTRNYFKLSFRKVISKNFPPNLSQLSRSLKLLSIVKKGEELRLATQSKLNIPVPYACVFSITWKCNLKCVGCYAKKYPGENQLSVDEIEKVISDMTAMGTYIFVIVGGEPLYVPGIVEILAKFPDAFFLLFSNGTLLTQEQTLRLKKAKNILPVLSIEGDKQMVDFRRGDGTGEKVLNAVEMLHKNKVPFGISAMVTHENLRDVLTIDWINSLWDRGVRFAFVIDYIPFPDSLNEKLILTEEDILFKKSAINLMNKKSKVTMFNFPEDEYKKAGCLSAGNGFIHVNANGFVEPCPFSHFAVDNVRDKSLPEILSSAFFSKLRDEFYNCSNPDGKCMLFYNRERVEEIAENTGAFSTEIK